MFKQGFLVVICILLTTSIYAQDFKININKLTEETQLLSDSPDKMRLVWWIPTDFWEAMLSQDQSISSDQADIMLSQFEKYTMIAAIDGDIDELGNIAYTSKDAIFEKLKVINDTTEEFSPLYEDEIDLDTQRLITFMKPVLNNMLGKVGENMYFFLFQRKDDPLHKIVDPKKDERFTVKLSEENFKFKLPLGSLLPPKRCTVDNALLNGSWKFCPYHGEKLVKK